MADTDMNTHDLDCVVLKGGDVCDYNDAPAPFRFEADSKTLKRLIRNCENAEIWSYSFDHSFPMVKGPILDYAGRLAADDRIACVFNGRNLTIFGPIDGTVQRMGDDDHE